MEIIVNGQPAECPEGCTVAELLARLGITTDGTAIARNDVIVRKAEHAGTRLEAGDRVEVIRAVAGG